MLLQGIFIVGYESDSKFLFHTFSLDHDSSIINLTRRLLSYKNLLSISKPCCLRSAGKSFVAEVLMLRRVIRTGKMALLVLPYVSICAEKVSVVSPSILHVLQYYFL